MMKKIISIIFLLFFIVNPTVNIHAQETSPKHKKLKEMKLNFILDNTDMSNEEAEHFQCVFGNYEDKYHTSVWIKERQIKKQIQKVPPPTSMNIPNWKKWGSPYVIIVIRSCLKK